jgi:hypothetical protein
MNPVFSLRQSCGGYFNLSPILSFYKVKIEKPDTPSIARIAKYEIHLLLFLAVLVIDLFSQMISVGSVTFLMMSPSFAPRKLSYFAMSTFGSGLLM